MAAAMANRLATAIVQGILQLGSSRCSQREITEKLAMIRFCGNCVERLVNAQGIAKEIARNHAKTCQIHGIGGKHGNPQTTHPLRLTKMLRVGIVGIGFMGMIHYLAYQKVRGREGYGALLARS